MAAVPGEYDDGGDEEFTLPLPREDRLWRHPSELADGELTLRLDPATIRNRWLSSQPSRASAWTAGLVGALLASGLVVLGTHLATALTGAPAPAADSATLSSAPEAPHTQVPSAVPQLAGLGSSLVSGVQHVGAAVVTIDVATAGTEVQILGVVIKKNGTILTASSALAGATSILVTLPGNEFLPAVTTASDTTSGLAVLRVNGVDDLAVASLAPRPVATSNFTIAVTAAGGASYTVGNVRQLDMTPKLATGPLLDALMTDLPADTTPPGSPVLDGSGQVIGLVAGYSPTGTAVVPSWLALPVAEQLMLTGGVNHGWIGISGETTTRDLGGALVTGVAAKSAAAEAGLQKGDVITSLNGAAVHSFAALQGRLYTLKPGANVTLRLTRGSSRITSHLRLDDQVAS